MTKENLKLKYSKKIQELIPYIENERSNAENASMKADHEAYYEHNNNVYKSLELKSIYDEFITDLNSLKL